MYLHALKNAYNASVVPLQVDDDEVRSSEWVSND